MTPIVNKIFAANVPPMLHPLTSVLIWANGTWVRTHGWARMINEHHAKIAISLSDFASTRPYLIF